ncbi:TetR-like C-terminal domain-containing protein [Lysinibacillus sp. NPDC092081]
MIQYWLQSNMKQTPEQLAQRISDIIFKGPVRSF